MPNNPFGLPDEVMSAVIGAVLKSQATGNKTPGNPLNVDPAVMAKKSASTVKQLYDAYVEVGFTETQAFELVKSILTKRN